MKISPKGPHAARLRKLKHHLLGTLSIPPEALPGSLAQCFRKCGKPTCRCVAGPGLPQWLLTYMMEGKKRVERIPEDWVEEVRHRVDRGRSFREKITEILNANAQLLVLWRREKKR